MHRAGGLVSNASGPDPVKGRHARPFCPISPPPRRHKLSRRAPPSHLLRFPAAPIPRVKPPVKIPRSTWLSRGILVEFFGGGLTLDMRGAIDSKTRVLESGWVEAGGAIGVGTDSHVGRDAADELRWLEYGQRLFTRRRNVLRWPGEAHTGAAAWRAAALGGAQALGRRSGVLAPGHRADLVVLRADLPDMVGLSGDAILDAGLFGGLRGLNDAVVVGGQVVVEQGRHHKRAEIMARFHGVLARLRA